MKYVNTECISLKFNSKSALRGATQGKDTVSDKKGSLVGSWLVGFICPTFLTHQQVQL